MSFLSVPIMKTIFLNHTKMEAFQLLLQRTEMMARKGHHGMGIVQMEIGFILVQFGVKQPAIGNKSTA